MVVFAVAPICRSRVLTPANLPAALWTIRPWLATSAHLCASTPSLKNPVFAATNTSDMFGGNAFGSYTMRSSNFKHI